MARTAKGGRNSKPAGYVVVRISEMRTQCSLGVYPVEKLRLRSIIVNVQYEYDASAAVRHDQLAEGLDYKSVRDEVIRVAGLRHYNLVESLASEIVDALRANPRIRSLQVEVIKPEAPKQAAAVSVSCSWVRSSR